MWPSLTEVLGPDSDSLLTIHPNLEKRGYRPIDGFQINTLPLDRIYVLAIGESVSSVRILEKDAFVELLKHSYADRLLGDSGTGPVHFKQYSQIVRQAPLTAILLPCFNWLVKLGALIVIRLSAFSITVPVVSIIPVNIIIVMLLFIPYQLIKRLHQFFR